MFSAWASEVFCGSTRLTPTEMMRSSGPKTTAPNGPPVLRVDIDARQFDGQRHLVGVAGVGADGIDGFMHPGRQGQMDLRVQHHWTCDVRAAGGARIGRCRIGRR